MYNKRFVFFALILIVLLASCQREVSDILPPDTIDSTDSTTVPSNGLIRKIQVTGHSFSEALNLTFLIQYDTLASRIIVLAEDSTGAVLNPDTKGIVYEFNKAGFLLKGTILLTNGTTKPEFAITRNAANQIEKVIEYDAEEVAGVSYNDTIHYRYGLGFIEDSVRIQSFGNTSFHYTRHVRTFDAQNKIQSFKYYAGNELYNEYSYRYDAQNNISRIVTSSDTIDYSYSTPADAEWKVLPELFLGKDAYVLLKERADDFGYNFLTFIIESKFETVYNPMFTQPLTRMVRHGRRFLNPNEEPVQSIVTFSTTYTPDGKTKTITVTPAGEEPINYTFYY